jgi:hypothetical protein
VIPRRIDVMRSMGTRRVALFAGAASVAAIALAGCSAGQIAETSLKKASTYGANVDNADGSVFVRGLAVSYLSPKGYPAGANAKLELSLFNQTTKPVTVQIGSQPLADAAANQGVVSAKGVGLVGPVPTAAPSAPAGPSESAKPPKKAGSSTPTPSSAPTPSSEPSPTIRQAEVTIPALSSMTFRPTDTETLQIVGLSAALVPGNSVNLIFGFSNGAAPLVVQAPVSIPLSPAPRGSALENENTEEGH